MKYNTEYYAKELYSYTDLETEVFLVIPLHSDGRIKSIEEIETISTEHDCTFNINDIVDISDVFESKKILIAHNHPNDTATPSIVDKDLTSDVLKLCEENDIELLDHIIVSKTGYFSFKDDNILNKRPVLVLSKKVC